MEDGQKKIIIRVLISVGALVAVIAITIGILVYLKGSIAPAVEEPAANTPVVLDQQDQPIDAALKLIEEGDVALGNYEFDVAREKYAAAQRLYVEAGSESRASDAAALLADVDFQEAEYERVVKPTLERDEPLVETGKPE